MNNSTDSVGALASLGTTNFDQSGRDAIHIAVISAVADEKLFPGQHVNFSEGQAWAGGDTVGIVDPYLDTPVFPGTRFWLLLYPRTITSLRHVWTHPSFPDEEGLVDVKEIIKEVPVPVHVNAWGVVVTDEVTRAVTRVSDIMRDSGAGGDIDAFIRSAIDQRYDEYLTVYGSDAHGDVPRSLWENIEIITGQNLGTDAGNVSFPEYFSCSC